MRYLLFFARVAFIFNLFFIACLAFRFNDVDAHQSIKGFLIVVGWLMAPIVNFIFNLCFLLAKVIKGAKLASMPVWLIAFNFILLIFQLVIMLLI